MRDNKLRLARDAVGEDRHKRITDGKPVGTGRLHRDGRRGERCVRPTRHHVHWQEERLLVNQTEQLDERVIGRRVLKAVAAGSFRDALKTRTGSAKRVAAGKGCGREGCQQRLPSGVKCQSRVIQFRAHQRATAAIISSSH